MAIITNEMPLHQVVSTMKGYLENRDFNAFWMSLNEWLAKLREPEAGLNAAIYHFDNNHDAESAAREIEDERIADRWDAGRSGHAYDA